MPRVPKYTLHKATGQARVRFRGKSYYLGAYGSAESRAKYEILIARLIGGVDPDTSTLRCDELAVRYLAYAATYYVKNGQQTPEVHHVRSALRYLVKGHGDTLCACFGPKALREVRQLMVEAGIVRNSVNSHVNRIRRAFKWAVGQELLKKVEVWQRLMAVESLAKGRSNAPESEPVLPVPRDLIRATLPHVNSQIRGMILTQWATGMRPGEVCSMRGRDLSPFNSGGESEFGFDLHEAEESATEEAAPLVVETEETVWVFTPESHKTEHRGRTRAIFIGPKAQQVLAPYLKANDDLPIFSPEVARIEQHASRLARRKAKRAPAIQNPDFTKAYTRTSYCQAIKRACKRAGLEEWHPAQLRHNTATHLRKEFGIEAARVVLGHGSTDVTEIYAEEDLEKARDAMRRVG